MKFFSLLAGAAALATSAVAQYTNSTPTGDIDHVTIFTPPRNYTVPRTLYARSVLLNQNCEEDNVILATWENYLYNNNSNPYFPIYQSYDGGHTWSERSRVYDQVNGWGLRYQPFLYELSEPIGNFTAGTILLAGSSIPDDLSETQLELYASTDKGYTWKFVSHVAHGGEALPNNGLTPVWEPFLMTYNNTLIYYYSDQRDPRYGQKMVHQVSSDLHTWGTVVDDIVYGTYDWRPGMPIVSELPLGQYIMTYEFYGAEEADFAVYYRISTDPTNFNASIGRPLIATDGTVPYGSPYNVWTPVGGDLGTIVVSCGNLGEVFLNHNLGAPGAWTKINTLEPASYTRSLLVLPGQEDILIVGGGVLGGEHNAVTASSVNIKPKAPAFAKCNAKK
ncbi:BNR/Asp-box repeat protein [Aureobasidium pullulans]|nr:BNR/Asp-box repeat protein [Aureobasidium pullulans]